MHFAINASYLLFTTPCILIKIMKWVHLEFRTCKTYGNLLSTFIFVIILHLLKCMYYFITSLHRLQRFTGQITTGTESFRRKRIVTEKHFHESLLLIQIIFYKIGKLSRRQLLSTRWTDLLCFCLCLFKTLY